MSPFELGDITKYGRLVNMNGEVLPEHVFHLPMQTFVYLNLDDIAGLEVWCTKNDQWDGPRKMHTFKFVDVAPYFQHIFLEENLEADGTVGAIAPLVCVLADGSVHVAVIPNKVRHFSGPNGLVEAPRYRHGSYEIMPKVVGDFLAEKLEQLGKNDLGMGLLNNARLAAAHEKLAIVGHDMTIYRGLEALPQLNGKFQWMPAEDFLLTSLDDPGKGVVATAIALGYLPALNQERIAAIKAEMPGIVSGRISVPAETQVPAPVEIKKENPSG